MDYAEIVQHMAQEAQQAPLHHPVFSEQDVREREEFRRMVMDILEPPVRVRTSMFEPGYWEEKDEELRQEMRFSGELR
jgi:hypothetical protein